MIAGAAGLLFFASSLEAQSAPTGTVTTPVITDTPAVAAAPPPPEPAPTHAFWIQAGVGVGTENWGMAAAATYQHRQHVFTARAVQTWEVLAEGGRTVYDLSLLYGRTLRTGHLHLSGGAGVGFIDWNCLAFADCGSLDTVVGLPIEVQLAWRPLRFAGIGLYGFANLNQLQHFAGAVVTLPLGYMR